MDSISFWKNFNLGKELSLSGNFIYNGLQIFDEMETFQNEEEIFEFLYCTAVGIERLEKIVLILQENISIDKIKDFEKSLITHNHVELMKRITNDDNYFQPIQKHFLKMLSDFYKFWRYDRFSFDDFQNFDKEKKAFITFLEKFYAVKITNDFFNTTSNSLTIKKSIGKCIGKIVNFLYEKTETYSRNQNIYTYEIPYNSKAYKIFIQKKFDFTLEEKMWKEILIFLLHNSENEYIQLYKTITPIDFDEADLVSLINALGNKNKRLEFIDNFESIYEEFDNKTIRKREELLDLIGNTNIVLDDDFV